MKVPRTCPICDVAYEADSNRLKHGRQTTCSRKCSYEFRARKLTTSIALTCSTCGDEFDRVPSHIKSKHEGVYCSRACHYAGRSAGLTKRVVTEPYEITEAGRKAAIENGKRLAQWMKDNDGYGHTDETRARLSEITTQNIMSGKINRVSKIEDEVAEELTALGIDFTRQHGIRDPQTGRYIASLDFFLENQRVAVEVNGTFWHADPRVYDRSDLTAAQRRTVERYTRKVKLLGDLGIELLEIWEHEIREDVKKAVYDVVRSFI